MRKSATKSTRNPSAKARRGAAKPAPRVGLVSLGCPKALVDSERIITTLRSQGYELSGEYADADVVLVNTCGFLDFGQEGEPGRHRRGHGRERPGDRHGLLRRREGPHPRRAPGRAGGHRAAPVRAGGGRRARGGAAAARSLCRSGAAGRFAPDAAPLRLFEDLGGLQQPLLVLHHPAVAREAGEPAGEPGDGGGRAAGEGRRQGAAGHQPGHVGLRARHPVCREPLEGPAAQGALSGAVPRRWARSAPGCGCTTSIPTRTSTPCCR